MPNSTAVTLCVKPWPLIFTEVPPDAAPLPGASPLSTGSGVYSSDDLSSLLPVTSTLPQSLPHTAGSASKREPLLDSTTAP